MDKHHPAGRANSPVTIPVPVNDHRAILSIAQYDWPKQTLENPNANPYLQMAGSIRGFLDMQRYIADKLLCPILENLEALAEEHENTEQ